MLEAMAFEYSPAQSFTKRFEKREKIAGYSTDGLRAYAEYFFHGANHVARLRWRKPMQMAVDEVKESIAPISRAGGDVTRRRKIQQYLEEHMNYVLFPGNELANLRAAGFLWYLAFVPKSAFVNLTQIPVIAAPYLSQRYGTGQAVGALKRSIRKARRAFSRDPQELTASEQRILKEAIENGYLDESFATELAATSEGNMIFGRAITGTKTEQTLFKISHMGAWMFQQAERWNRRHVFFAAAELARNNPNNEATLRIKQVYSDEVREMELRGWGHDDAVAYIAGREAVLDTQYEYNRWARPKFMQGKKSVIFLFYSYLQNTLWFLRHDPAAVRALGVLFALAGLQGLPGAEDAANIYRLFVRNLTGNDVDIWREARELIVETGADPSLFLSGLGGKTFGWMGELTGIPIPNMNISSSVSMGRIIPGVEALGAPGNFEQKFMQVSTDVGGAAFAIPMSILQALADTENPDAFKRWERALPSALRNVARAYRYGKEGREKTQTGATLVEFDPTDPEHTAEIIGQAMGFQPSRVATEWSMRRMQQEAERHWVIRHRMLLRSLDHALQIGDREGIADAYKAIRVYNSEVPDPALAINVKQIRRSLRQRALNRAKYEAGVATPSRLQGEYEAIEALFPGREQ
jgi:hypothetical protein